MKRLLQHRDLAEDGTDGLENIPSFRLAAREDCAKTPLTATFDLSTAPDKRAS